MIYSVLLNQGLNGLLNRVLGQHISIFTLHRPQGRHGLTGIDVDMLDQFLSLLKKHKSQFISIDDLINQPTTIKPDKNYVCFTIDDGYQDQVDELIPVLLEHHTSPTLFVITDLVDKADIPWDAAIADAVRGTELDAKDVSSLGLPGVAELSFTDKRQARRTLSAHAKRLPAEQRNIFVQDLRRLLSFPGQSPDKSFRAANWEELRQLETRGLRVGSHTCSHQPLSTLVDDAIANELTFSLGKLRENLSNPSSVLCYPVGMREDYDDRAITLAKQAGYTGAVTSEPGFYRIGPDSDRYQVPRLSLPATLSIAVRYASWFEKLRLLPN